MRQRDEVIAEVIEWALRVIEVVLTEQPTMHISSETYNKLQGILASQCRIHEQLAERLLKEHLNRKGYQIVDRRSLAKVFLSAKSEDYDHAYDAYRFLVDEGIDVFFSPWLVVRTFLLTTVACFASSLYPTYRLLRSGPSSLHA